MAIARIPQNEAERLEALRRYDILDTLEDQAYDDLTQLAASIAQSPIALISLVDKDRLWFKSKVGLRSSQMPREHTFCSHAIVSPSVAGDELFIVGDALEDERFADNSVVVNEPRIRFYAAAMLVTPDNFPLGTLCVLDRQPRQLSDSQRAALNALGRQVITQLELRRSAASLKHALFTVEERTRQLEATQSNLLRTARLAGMAEIAANVLHNVGNVLTSVNTSAGLIRSKVRNLKAQGHALEQASELLKKEVGVPAPDAPAAGEGKLALLPKYFDLVAGSIAAEQQGIAEEVDHLADSIEHISDVVAMQQAYAGTTRLEELTSVTELVDEALRVSSQALGSGGVTVDKQFSEVPPLMLDRTRTLRILIDLIGNAVDAMDDRKATFRRLVVQVDTVDRDANIKGAKGNMRALRIRMQDEGRSIPQEDLTRIFAFGFAVRPGGNSLGLHGSAIAAVEMGGSLTASSDGQGKGAVFTLELPMQVTS